MFFRIISLLMAFAISTITASLPLSGTVYVTPHSQFSSSIGVLGCKVDTDRIAYWPAAPDCTNMCIKLTFGSRSRTVLHIDTSGGNYDISFDTFQYLAFGSSATASPAILNANAGASMDYEIVDMSECSDIITSDTGKLSFIAVSPNQVQACLSQSGSWVAQNYELLNIANSQCQYGIDESCTFNVATRTVNCPSGAGANGNVALSPAQPVIDYIAPCGVTATAGGAAVVADGCSMVTQTPNPSS
ncbi:hypothetical protein VSDG_02960 [Cytospora chrysosperma]|uniref:Uncharacterized protein n=1 Tax=Cytospora chrysosperma TaxID=252740 RepID=A0A423W8R4_CYTCH|nr:hypothetical protein VSDG_02960 [Valsa sordida]